MSSAHIHKTGSRIFCLAIGVVAALGTLSPASQDVKADTTSDPYINGLVNPAYAGLPMSAREVPEKRSEKAAVFQVGNDKYAAISFGSPMFTDVDGQWMPIDQSGRREGDAFVFDRLAEGVDISFDLTKPQYTLMQNGQGFTVAFAASAAGRMIDDKTVEYVLADGAILTWTVSGNHVHKEILVEKYGIAQNIAFTIAAIGNLHLQKTDEVLSLLDDQEKEVFLFTEPFLAKDDGAKLDEVITLRKTGNQYRYFFNESVLPLPYIIDPTSGPNSPDVAVSDGTVGFTAWQSLGFDLSSDLAGHDGDVATVGLTSPANFESSVKIVKGGSISGTDKSTGAAIPVNDTYVSYGGSSDLWGLSWTPADINAIDFGAAFSVIDNTADDSEYLKVTDFDFAIPTDATVDGILVEISQQIEGGSTWVDHIRISVTYTESGGGGGGDPVPAISFASGGLALAGILWSRRRSKHPS